MNKAEIMAKTMKYMAPIGLQVEPPFSEEQDEEEFIISVLQDLLSDGVDIKVCDDFRHLNVQCCRTCHEFYPHYDMSLIDLPGGGKAWVCDTVKWALYRKKYRALQEWSLTSAEGKLVREIFGQDPDEKVAP
jgi:hypothetical protein